MLRWNPYVSLVLILVALALVGPGMGIADFGFDGLGRGFKW